MATKAIRGCAYREYHSFPDADIPFSGNPAGVCLLPQTLPDVVMQGIAASNRHAETAFIQSAPGGGSWQLRWFTPHKEIALCGHATLAAAAMILDQRLAARTVMFNTQSGPLEVLHQEGQYLMSLPTVPSVALTECVNPQLLAALGLAAEQVLEAHAIEPIHQARYLCLCLLSEQAVADLSPDHNRLRHLGINVIVTAEGQSADFVSRFFAPALGVEEDPVTGATHCTLAPYWAERLGKSCLSARQIGPRPGALNVELVGERVALLGEVRLYLQGHLCFGC